jgi:hypothetical protein
MIDVKKENVFPLREAAQRLSVSYEQVRRWSKMRTAPLETVIIGTKAFTSLEAIQRFSMVKRKSRSDIAKRKQPTGAPKLSEVWKPQAAVVGASIAPLPAGANRLTMVVAFAAADCEANTGHTRYE